MQQGLFSYTGPEAHTVIAPFGGQFNTAKAAMGTGRHSGSAKIGARYFGYATTLNS